MLYVVFFLKYPLTLLLSQPLQHFFEALISLLLTSYFDEEYKYPIFGNIQISLYQMYIYSYTKLVLKLIIAST